MRSAPRRLINTALVEAWPAWLLRARANRDARALSRASHVLRRKRDGRFLAAVTVGGATAGASPTDGTQETEVLPLVPGLSRERGVGAALEALEARPPRLREGFDAIGHLPVSGLRERLDALGLDADGYAARTGLELVAEPAWLALAGFDRFRRPLWLHAEAARAWSAMQVAALRDGVVLEAISGYRSHAYQLGIFERKRARGLAVDEILAVNAAPGFSEHHSGRALDIGTPGEPPAEETFEATAAFEWLSRRAGGHGFAMSYPRDNPHGIVYEPWHWAFGID